MLVALFPKQDDDKLVEPIMVNPDHIVCIKNDVEGQSIVVLNHITHREITVVGTPLQIARSINSYVSECNSRENSES
jgi:hypothetical protein